MNERITTGNNSIRPRNWTDAVSDYIEANRWTWPLVWAALFGAAFAIVEVA